jgi:1-aminocyclopropane-1-carboxylate deaminase/D-cysteine desulfhydrase-like pyridoxal-dependent ACC family enzyme
MSDSRALFNRYSTLRNTLPFIPLADLPTPVHRLTALEDAVGIDALWVKRDDLTAGDYGGNKIRKLEFLLAAAQQNNSTTVITFGGLGSNHALATSINCKKLGLNCVAILTPEPPTNTVRRTLRYHQLLGTRIEIAHNYAETRAVADSVRESIGAQFCYEIPFGGSSWLGALGFVDAAFELQQQIQAGNLPCPDQIYIGCGTAGSTAGLAVGLLLAGLTVSLEAVQVTPDSIRPDKLFHSLFHEINQELSGRDSSIPTLNDGEANVNIRNDQLGEGYAIPTEAGLVAADLIHDNAGFPASLTYTAKTMAALMSDAGRGLLTGKNVLFWNTYNSRPYPELPSDDSWRKLPAAIHPVFTSA